ncbi:MAG: TetR family transcriptional regulator [Halioglobus sp.]|nr:TetR family transcriptional regulator [Halioglobus sp.]
MTQGNASVLRDKSGRHLGSRARKTRQRFLDATAKLLAERSILEISVTEIAREVDSVSSLFYHYFESVEDAARHLVREAGTEMPAIVELIDGSWDGDEGLQRARDLSRAYLEHWERNHGVLLLRNQAADRGDRKFLALRRRALEPLIDKLTELISQAQAQGQVTADLHPYLAASALVSILEKLSAYARSLRQFNADRDDLVDTCARMIYNTVTGH